MSRRVSLSGQKGQTVVEFAFVCLLFFFVIFGITEFSRALYTYGLIVQATRTAARWAVVNVAGNSDATNIARAKNIVVYGDPNTSSGSPQLPGLTRGHVNVAVQTIETGTNGIPISQKIVVSISGYQFQFLVPLAPNMTIPAFETSLYTESMGSTG